MRQQTSTALAVKDTREHYDVSRRHFLQLAGGLAGAGVLFSACKKTYPSVVGLGTGDIGILNFAYALEQLEAEFYTQVVSGSNFTTIFTADEQALITDIRDHEIAHREFFKAALGDKAIKKLDLIFSSVDFNDKTSILKVAKTLEDTGVAAYNYAGSRISVAGLDYLRVAGKIASVEARHAAAIKDMISYSSFSFTETADDNGLDQAFTYSDVNIVVHKYFKDGLDYGKLP